MKTVIIEYLSGERNGETQKFSKLSISIGSSITNDLVVEEIGTVSPNHVTIINIDGNFILNNYSINGTLINGELSENTIIKNGDIIQLGNTGPVLNFREYEPCDDLQTEGKPEQLYRRWYDKSVFVSNAMNLLKNREDINVFKVIKALILKLNQLDANVIFAKSDLNIVEEIKNLPAQERWYDSNRCIQQVVEMMKLATPETQETIAKQIISLFNENKINEMYLAENLQKKEFSTCPNCKITVNINNTYCFNCGYQLRQSIKKSSNLISDYRNKLFHHNKYIPDNLNNLIKKYKSFWVYSVIVILIIVGIGTVKYVLENYINEFELKTYDLRAKLPFKTVTKNNNIVLLNIDDNSLEILEEYLGKWPWTRDVYAKLIQILDKSGAKVIALDLLFLGHQQGFENKDQELINTVKASKKVYLPMNFNNRTESNSLETINEIQKFSIAVKENTNYDFYFDEYSNCTPVMSELLINSKKIGINNAKIDDDGVLRKADLLFKYHDKFYPSLPLKIAMDQISEKYKSHIKELKIDKHHNLIIGNTKIPLQNNGSLLINWYKPNQTFESIPIWKLIKSIKQLESGTIPILDLEKTFKNKIVIIGASTSSLDEIKPTPVSNYLPEIEIKATIISNIINNQIMNKAPWYVNLLVNVALLLLISTSFFIINKSFKAPIFAIILNFIVLIGFIILNYLLFNNYFYWLDLVNPVLISILVIACCVLLNLMSEKQNRVYAEGTLSKYISPQLFISIMKGKKNIDLISFKREVSVLFCDIRNFTPFVEDLEPEEISQYINEYFTEMVEVIIKNKGTVDKFMGDAIMAFWGAPESITDHPLWAAITALEMLETLEKLNDKWIKEGRKKLDIGIGINSGIALVGNFGSPRLMDYTVMGDTVNLASRLESLNKEEHTHILISEYTYDQIKDRVKARFIGQRKVKGKTQEVDVYELLNL